MNTLVRILITSTMTIAMLQNALGQSKASYDVQEPSGVMGRGLAKTEAMGLPGWKVKKTYGEIALLPGGFFTFGTKQGQTSRALDANCGITFGHPFARTSYPLVCIDGVWSKPEETFDITGGTASVEGDSIVLAYDYQGKVALTLGAKLDNDGRMMTLSSTIRNIDGVDHTLGLGFVLDPALGLWGDGVLAVGNVMMERDTVLTAGDLSQRALAISERNGSPAGMRVSLEFGNGTSPDLVVGNWDDLHRDDGPTPGLTVRDLYDLVLAMHWQPQTVVPAGELVRTMSMTLMTPDFGNQVFVRWDLPDHLEIADGLAFPSSFSSMARLNNAGSISRPSGTLQLVTPGPGFATGDRTNAAVGSDSTAFATVPVYVEEIFTSRVVPVTLVYREGETAVDSLKRKVLVPPTPVSDTGLVVTIDSLILSGWPTIGISFDVQRQATGIKIPVLKKGYVELTDNGTPVDEFTVGFDTTSGGSTDIVFVLDVTGSMYNEIEAVKNNIQEFADSLLQQRRNIRLGMVTFGDEIRNVYDFTTNVALFKSYVAAQSAIGGDDLPENSLDALYRATQFQFNEKAQHLLIWITDADYHEADYETPKTKQDVVNRLLLTDCTVECIGSPDYQTDWYNPIIGPTDGWYYNINLNFRDILLDIARRQAFLRFLLTFTPPTASSHDLALTVHYAGLGGTATTTIGGSPRIVPHATVECFPSPFNPETTVRVHTAEPSTISLVIYNVLGQEVRRFETSTAMGSADVRWNGKNNVGGDVAAGAYFIRCDVRSIVSGTRSRVVTRTMYVK